jgi:hypothetical protein
MIKGIKSDEEFYMVQSAAQMYCKPMVGFKVKTWELQKKNILEIIIPESKTKPHFAPDENKEWKGWIRVNDCNMAADEVLLEIWKLSKVNSGLLVKYDHPEKILLDYLYYNEFIDLDKFMSLAIINKLTAVRILAKLVVLKIIIVKHAIPVNLYSYNK